MGNSKCGKLLGAKVDSKLIFKAYVGDLCKKKLVENACST